MADKKVSDLLQEKRGSGMEKLVANAPILFAVFANFVVLVADYRVYDVIYQLTGIWWKALAASLACAVPFLLWEIGWQYNHTTDTWRVVSLLMAGLAFVTSTVLGIADYVGFTSDWADLLLGGVVILTGVHAVVGLLYFYNDPDVARRRRKSQALAKMQDQEINSDLAASILARGNVLLDTLKRLEAQYPADDIERVLAILNGVQYEDKPNGKPQQPRPPQQNQMQVSLASDTPHPELKKENPTNPPKQNQ